MPLTTQAPLERNVSALLSRPENQLLLACSRVHIDSATVNKIKSLLQQFLNWDYLLKTSFQHGVMPLLCKNLESLGAAIPQAVQTQLKQYYQANAARNLFLSKKLLEALDLFAAHDLPVVPFKGPVLAQSIYGSLSLRQSSDLDILVQPKDFSKAIELLVSQGYQPKEDAYDWEYSLTANHGTYSIDLHQGLVQRSFPFSLDVEGIGQRSETLVFLGKTINNLSPEDLLLSLCMLIAKDAWTDRLRLIQIIDIAELIETHPDINWERLIELAVSCKGERVLLLSLILGNELIGISIPASVQQRVQKNPGLKVLAAWICNRLLFQQNDGLERSLRFGGIDFIQLAVMDQLQDKLEYCFRILLNRNEKDATVVSLSSSLSFLHYPIRFTRLVKTYGVSADKLDFLWRFLRT